MHRLYSLGNSIQISNYTLPAQDRRDFADAENRGVCLPTLDQQSVNHVATAHPMASNIGNIITNLVARPHGKVAWVTISRTSKLNSLNTHLLTRLPSALETVQREKELLAVVLTGDDNKAFVGGADLFEMGGLKTGPEASQFITRVHHACRSIRTCPVPVIARLNGYTLGAGVEIAASCDLRVASRNSDFGMPEVWPLALLPGG
jgi:enoyl-CoA hydratase/carnithine racemase